MLPGRNACLEGKNARDSFRQVFFEEVSAPTESGIRLLDTIQTILPPEFSFSEYTPLSEVLGLEEVLDDPDFPTICMLLLERLYFLHFLQILEKRKTLSAVKDIIFLLDGPLVFPTALPDFLVTGFRTEINRLNEKQKAETQKEMTILGLEKSGPFRNFLDHLEEFQLPAAEALIPLADFISRYILSSLSFLRFSFGAPFFYHAPGGQKFVLNIADFGQGPEALSLRLPEILTVVNSLVSTRYPDALYPLAAAHSDAAVTYELGRQLFEELAKKYISSSPVHD